jgi:hypothetical protein
MRVFGECDMDGSYSIDRTEATHAFGIVFHQQGRAGGAGGVPGVFLPAALGARGGQGLAPAGQKTATASLDNKEFTLLAQLIFVEGTRVLKALPADYHHLAYQTLEDRGGDDLVDWA